MNIVLATDEKFANYCAITIKSVLMHNCQVSFFVITEGLSKKSSKFLKDLVENTNNKLTIVNVNSNLFKRLPMPKNEKTEHISLATYYRLFLPDLLPSIDKAIYLDCDIIVRKPLDELWNIDMHGACLGAVYQICEWNVEAIKRLGYDSKYGYFNAGVLLMNLKQLRLINAIDLMMQYIKYNYSTIIYHDQDVLNAVLYDKTIRLSCRWNMLSSYFYKEILRISDFDGEKLICDHSDYKRILPKLIKDPDIVHFVSRPKPWEAKCSHPYKYEFDNVALSLNIRFDAPLIFRLKYMVKMLIFRYKYFFNEML